METTTNTKETFSTLTIGDYTVVLSSLTQAHIDMHNQIGTGSAFVKPFTLDMLPEQITPGPNRVVTDNVVGWSLVDKLKYAQHLPGSNITTATKEGVIDGVLQDIEVPAVETTMPLEYFETHIYTVLLFGYNPEYATDELKAYIEANNLQEALVLGSAFPGEFGIRGIDVPAASGDKGTKWTTDGWAVIIPTQE